MDLETKLEAFADYKCEYVQLCINAMNVSRGLHGSIMSEKTHSSALCHLNDSHNRIKNIVNNQSPR